jgi:hypothetical protein
MEVALAAPVQDDSVLTWAEFCGYSVCCLCFMCACAAFGRLACQCKARWTTRWLSRAHKEGGLEVFADRQRPGGADGGGIPFRKFSGKCPERTREKSVRHPKKGSQEGHLTGHGHESTACPSGSRGPQEMVSAEHLRGTWIGG